MTNNKFKQIAEEAVLLEENVAALYRIFRDNIPVDGLFWDELAHEEDSHALLINGTKDFIEESPSLRQMIPSSLEEIQDANNHVKKLIAQYSATPPSRQEALKAAAELEQSAGEMHYQRAMEMSSDSKMLTLFQNLNNDDMNHLRRISEYTDYISIHG